MGTQGRVGTLIVDDEPDLRLLIRMAIEARNEGLYVAGEAGDGETAVRQLDELGADVVVLDQMMPGIDGLETARRMRSIRPEQHIVLFTAFLDDELRRSADEIGVDACFSKSDLKQLPDFLFHLAR
jgi:DNA-binding NarL/FixJ family response regulator